MHSRADIVNDLMEKFFRTSNEDYLHEAQRLMSEASLEEKC